MRFDEHGRNHFCCRIPIGTVKTKDLGDYVPFNSHEVRRMLFQYIEGFDNHQRLRSSLAQKTPAAKERYV